ncbi:Divalent Anion:Na+ Symporter [Blattamonas nauphoetae]|uniref:Divalent Anion:Na+ Symporter n=1 Tax=Blattamonas nauphoetae TaxID=2049346 RepID=A0ABQ9YF76_9EUKA|nr:Divalent Anion:Na+ Symporter [Blattamonas nauphoetae]
MKYSRELRTLMTQRWEKEYIRYFDLRNKIHVIFHHYIRNIKTSPENDLDLANKKPQITRTQSTFQVTDARKILEEKKKQQKQQTTVKFRGLDKKRTGKALQLKHTLRSTNQDESDNDDSTRPLLSTMKIRYDDERSLDEDSDRPSRPSRNKTPNTAAIEKATSETRMILRVHSTQNQPIHSLFPLWAEEVRRDFNRVSNFITREMHNNEARYSKLLQSIQKLEPTHATALELKQTMLILSVDITELSIFKEMNKRGYQKLLTHLNKVTKQKTDDEEEERSPLNDDIQTMLDEVEDVFNAVSQPSALLSTLHTLFVDTFSVGPFTGDCVAEQKILFSTMDDDEFQKAQLSLLEEITSSTAAQIAWRKNSIAAQILAYQRKAQYDFGEGLGGNVDDHGMNVHEEQDTTAKVDARTGLQQAPRVKFYFKVKYPVVVVAFLVLIMFGVLPWPQLYAKQMRCLGLLVWACILWGMDAIPSHVTAMGIPIFACFLKLIEDGSYSDWAKRIVSSTISNTPYLAIGGFSIALAMKNSGLDKKISSLILTFKIVQRPRVFILVFVILETVMTMFISNVSSTVLVVSFILPVIRELPPDSQFIKALLMGIAMAGNLSGMATPLASPQSLVGLEGIVNVMGAKATMSFGKWTISALPLTIASLLLNYFLLFCFFKIDIDRVPCPPTKMTCLTFKQGYVATVSLATIVFWFILPYCPFLGNEAIVGMIPFFAFFGFNCVQKTEIAELPWSMILLVMGGGALGESVKQSKLLDLIATLIGSGFQKLHFYPQLLLLVLIVGVVSIFVSHTVAALVLIPIVGSLLGTSGKHLELILMACALEISPPMLLAVASFPNMCCYAVEDSNHKSYLTTTDFFRYGGTVTLTSTGLVLSLFFVTGLIMKL